MAMITNEWLDAVKPEFSKEYYKDLFCFVKDEYSKCVVYPPADDIFNAFHFTPLSKVKVLILGQDPYHNVHQAHGLSFSVPQDQREIPPSLQNIYKELHNDLGCDIPDNGYLKKWADQGVLLLNTVLTVRAHQAGSHQGKGWEQFTDAVIQAVNAQEPVASMNPAMASVSPTMASMKRPVVCAMSPQLHGMRQELSERPIIIGRSRAECAILFPEGTPGISRKHCSVAWNAASGNFVLTDMSTYGTYLQNGQRLNPGVAYYLKAGECFYLGEDKNMFCVNLD